MMGVSLLGCTVVTPEPLPPYALVSPQEIEMENVNSLALPTFHTVQAGETLSVIARRYGMAWQQIARLNQLSPPYPLNIGQKLRLQTGATPIASSRKQVARDYAQPDRATFSQTQTQRGSCSPAVNWQWPTRGAIRPSVSESGRKGIRIAGKTGQTIRAAAAGQVIHSSDGLQGYRHLIIIQHNPAFLSVYANNQRRLVREGTRVTSGQVIADMGLDNQQQAALHFEIRCQGKAVDPLPYLPNISR
ncbi:peptidoglycan DD-metalloendopeptidase family protein [Thioflexithrix psekupsensis]|uniref:LysM domain-containing protein n=1 Tax=Thioflexithrix psekupsensis TaxID=1570016 RepID=A0A251X6E2_9GAMM|nr:peptidoglycan DD-metalloendopeptidase family protein [Thioflexithrix psekupsensis]OUD13208.1 hypothetical protein TPSD3_11255 [Thioflexithrix psekupsensis]